MDLGGWLRSLGLEQYEAVFRENAVDETVLRDITDQDLEKLGVLLGHRRRLKRRLHGDKDGLQLHFYWPCPTTGPRAVPRSQRPNRVAASK